MGISIGTLVINLIGTILCGITVWLAVGSKNPIYDGYIEALDSNTYFAKEFYGIGYYLLEKLNINYDSRRFYKREKSIAEIKGKKYARFYMVADFAGMITYVVVFSTIGILIGGIAGDPTVACIGVALGVVLAAYLFLNNKSSVDARHEQIMREYPHFLSKIALLINAGMPLREAIAVAIEGKKTILSEEFEAVLIDMKNGSSDIDAMLALASRCNIPEIKKLVSLIVQNLQKGSAELGQNLMAMSTEVWNERVGHVKELGEKASAKLLIPILIIFAGILLMVIVPVFSSLSF